MYDYKHFWEKKFQKEIPCQYMEKKIEENQLYITATHVLKKKKKTNMKKAQDLL